MGTDAAIKLLAEATGKSEAAIRETLFDIKSKAWKRYRAAVKDEDALEALGNVLAFAAAAEELKTENEGVPRGENAPSQ